MNLVNTIEMRRFVLFQHSFLVFDKIITLVFIFHFAPKNIIITHNNKNSNTNHFNCNMNF